jgi:hypothetical protein
VSDNVIEFPKPEPDKPDDDCPDCGEPPLHVEKGREPN